MYDTLIDITFLSTKIMHPTRCNKEAQVICDVGCIPRIPHVVKMSTTTQILKWNLSSHKNKHAPQ